MNESTIWKTVAVRLSLLNALKKEHKRTKEDEDKPTRVVDKLIRAHLEEKGIKVEAE
jgi:hypothetical protein